MKTVNLQILEKRVAAIPVPPFDFSTVSARRPHTPEKTTSRRKIISAALLLIVLPAIAAAAAHFIPLQVTHRVGNWQLWGPSKTYEHPTAADFSRLARQAPYRVTWPVGVPREHKLLFLGAVGSEVFLLAYACPGKSANSSTSMLAIIPKNYESVNPNLGKWFESQIANDRVNERWNAGEESVVLTTDCLARRQIDRIRTATIAAGSLQR